jgi:hypothetical protein
MNPNTATEYSEVDRYRGHCQPNTSRREDPVRVERIHDCARFPVHTPAKCNRYQENNHKNPPPGRKVREQEKSLDMCKRNRLHTGKRRSLRISRQSNRPTRSPLCLVWCDRNFGGQR